MYRQWISCVKIKSTKTKLPVFTRSSDQGGNGFSFVRKNLVDLKENFDYQWQMRFIFSSKATVKKKHWYNIYRDTCIGNLSSIAKQGKENTTIYKNNLVTSDGKYITDIILLLKISALYPTQKHHYYLNDFIILVQVMVNSTTF
jgi:hypothetical protein